MAASKDAMIDEGNNVFKYAEDLSNAASKKERPEALEAYAKVRAHRPAPRVEARVRDRSQASCQGRERQGKGKGKGSGQGPGPSSRVEHPADAWGLGLARGRCRRRRTPRRVRVHPLARTARAVVRSLPQGGRPLWPTAQEGAAGGGRRTQAGAIARPRGSGGEAGACVGARTRLLRTAVFAQRRRTSGAYMHVVAQVEAEVLVAQIEAEDRPEFLATKARAKLVEDATAKL
eukprot:1494047-Prymnesium_polylepis.2